MKAPPAQRRAPDLREVIVEVEVTTDEANEGDHILERLDTAAASLGVATADDGHACAKVFGGLADARPELNS